MAGGSFATAAGDVHYEARITFAVIISCIMAATGGLMFGYDIGISGTYNIINLFFLWRRFEFWCLGLQILNSVN